MNLPGVPQTPEEMDMFVDAYILPTLQTLEDGPYLDLYVKATTVLNAEVARRGLQPIVLERITAALAAKGVEDAD